MNPLPGKIYALLNTQPLAKQAAKLFCELLHWNHPAGLTSRTLPPAKPIAVPLQAEPVAQLAGLPVYLIAWPSEQLPGVTVRRAVQRALQPVHTEHLIVYVSPKGDQAAFTWARRRADDRIELRTLPFQAGSPARTTVERLSELAFSLEELERVHGNPPVTAVIAKLDAAFDVEAVTKQFYQEIANWYFWAREHVEFPVPKGTPNPDAYQAQSLIRLITRLIFCWFVKQKGLIPGALFDQRTLAGILKNGANLSAGEETTYYKAILQNLFFATLNQEMDQRAFRKRNKHPDGRDPHHGITNLYRYEDYFADPLEFLRLMKDIPFLNGGLFECLDKVYRAEEKLPDVRMDGFSDHPKNPLRVPDFLFFGEERMVDLSAAYGEKRYRQAQVRGLIHTFARYNFTITEATPLDQEVALDPELSGKVFENLLAAYNPETATTARKQTGSFYTPREIVDYMVDEALLAYLDTKVKQTILSAPSTTEPAQTILSASNTAAGGQTGLSASPFFIPYNPEAETQRTRRRLPHWTQESRTYFVTFRLADSLPQDKLKQWVEEKEIWLKFHPEPWSDKDWAEYNDRFGKKLEEWLDAGHGACHLARPEVRAIVEECLNHFDGQRYDLGGYVIMPNHVHMLIRPREGFELSEIMKGIKGVSSRKVRQTILSASNAHAPGQTGLSPSPHFWMDESFDHIVRSQAQFQKFQRYIAENPQKAGRKPGTYTLNVEQTILSAPNTLAAGQSGSSASPSLESRLRHLLAYNDEPHQFTPAEVKTLIEAIDNLKALDPACGSGAFPMGLLHKLVFILGKLDPHNEQWKQQQIAKAGEIPDATVREKTLADIEQAFAANELDYGRKLYLIENCIYGVDIQPIAVQIAKMRFFISLIVDQRVDDTKPNRGILSLPNLETKFVAANTLIGIERPRQMVLRNPQIDAKEAELRKVRERHFTARTPATKARCREQDAKLRAEISELLQADGFARETTEKLARWDPYDQNASADFFDPEWMFGLPEGFHLVIGNPPYGLLNKRQNKAESIVVTPEVLNHFKTAPLYQPAVGGMINIFRLFIVRSIDLLRSRGVFSEIFPLAFTADASMGNLRKYLLKNYNIHFIEAFPERDNIAKRVFEASKMSVCIMQLERETKPEAMFYVRLNRDRFVDLTAEKAWLTAASVSLLDKENATIPLVTQRELDLLEKIYRQSIRVGDLGHCFTGEVDLTLGEEFITQDSRNPPLLRGAGIAKYCVLSKMSQGEFLYLNDRAFLRTASAHKVAHTKTERIVLQGITGVNERTRLRMTLVPPGTYLANSVNYLIFDSPVNLKAILGILNSGLINFVFSKFSTNSNVNGYEVDNLPLPKTTKDQNETAEHDALVKLVERILAAKRADAAADVTAWEREIDERVYRLYGLTPEEIKIVEEGANR